MTTLSMAEENGPFERVRYSTSLFIPLILVGGIALAAVAYLLIMQSAGWKSDKLSGVPVIALNLTDADVYLLRSKHTDNYFTSVGGNYDLILNQWRYFFQAKKVRYVDVSDRDLVGGLKPGVLILPSAVALDSTERDAIRKFEEQGGSILATWATGARGGSGQWLGYDFLHDQFGVSVTGEIKKADVENFLMPFGETPVSHSLPSGNRIWLDQFNERPLRITGGLHVAGRFMDVVRTPGADPANQAIVYDEVNGSRRVLFGFSETSWRFQQQDIYTLLLDTLDWLRRQPTGYLAYWPYPYRSASITEMDTEQGFANSRDFARLLDENHIRGTFYCLTSVAVQYPEIVKELERRHEIAFHGDVHDGFKGQSREVQGKRLDAMLAQLRPLLADPKLANGFRAPLELYDDTTEALLAEKGFRHHLADSNKTPGRIPFLSKAASQDLEKGLVVLPRTQRDDINLLRAGLSGQDMSNAMIGDFDLAQEMGALGVLSVHSQNFEPGSALARALPDFLKHAKSQSGQVWLAPSGQIESWWRERGRLRFDLSGEAGRMALNVTVEPPGISEPVSIVVLNPVRKVVPNLTATKVAMPLPELVQIDEFSTALVFRSLKPGDYNYYLGY